MLDIVDSCRVEYINDLGVGGVAVWERVDRTEAGNSFHKR